MSESNGETPRPEQRSKFEWRPEDIVILKPGDEGHNDDYEENEEMGD